MSGIGKGTLSRRKKNFGDSRFPAIGVKNLEFAHQALVDDAQIDFSSLMVPASWATSGRTNPSSGEILSANLFQFKDHVTLSSNMRGYIQKTQYKVYSDRIVLLTFVAYADEEFIVEVSDTAKSGTLLVDASVVNCPGALALDETDFNFGKSVPLEGAVVVYRDGIQMFQNTNNSDTTLDGNYYIIPTTANEGSIVSFNDAAGVGGANVLVASNASLVETPNMSMMQEIESVAGQVDAIIPTVAALAGVAETVFQSMPNNVDLKNFGDIVIGLLNSQIGDVRTSMLTESQFQATNGTEWVLMDGRSVTGSKFEQVTGNTSIPDGRGVFLRGKNNGRIDTNENPDGESPLGTFQDDELGSHRHSAIGHNSSGGILAGPNDYLLANAFSGGTRYVNYEGGNETRPKNITVNYFMKID